jgi:zinc protease
LGFPGATIHSEDRWALGLLDAACSDMGSRIFLKIRDELGLAYYCGATNLLGRSPGYFAFYVGCAKESLARVEEELWGEITKLTASPLAVDELDRIKAKIIGQMKISRQSLDDEALSASLDELYGLGFANRERDIERYQSVTSKEIQEIAAKYFKRDTSVVATISA